QPAVNVRRGHGEDLAQLITRCGKRPITVAFYHVISNVHAENQQLSEQGSAPIRALMTSTLIGAQQGHPPVPRSATHLCPPMQCCQSVPSSCASQCHLYVPPH
ncbi:unnamed protein product, partial [Staurois parvus]